MFWRGCGQDTGNLSDHRLASWGDGFRCCTTLLYFFFSLCVGLGDVSLTQWQMPGPLELSHVDGGMHFLLLKIVEVTSEGYSSTLGSLLNLSPVVSSSLTKGHSCTCVLSPCLMSAWCWWSLLEKWSHCSCNGAERPACDRNWSLFFFGNFVVSAVVGMQAEMSQGGRSLNIITSHCSLQPALWQTRGGENIFPMVLGEHKECPICWRSVQIWEAGSCIWELEIARKKAKLQNLYVNKTTMKLLSSTDVRKRPLRLPNYKSIYFQCWVNQSWYSLIMRGVKILHKYFLCS